MFGCELGRQLSYNDTIPVCEDGGDQMCAQNGELAASTNSEIRSKGRSDKQKAGQIKRDGIKWTKDAEKY